MDIGTILFFGGLSAAIYTATDKRRQIIATAKKMLGNKYLIGGCAPGGFDCSGLVVYSYKSAGVEIPRTAEKQFNASNLYYQNPKRGDLVFFETIPGKISHVGIILNKNEFIHSGTTSNVSIQKLNSNYWRPKIIAYGNILN